MDKPPARNVTQILRERNAGSKSTSAELMALVHEAFLCLVDATGITWQDSTHFFAIAVNALRRILVDYVREKCADQPGGYFNLCKSTQ